MVCVREPTAPLPAGSLSTGSGRNVTDALAPGPVAPQDVPVQGPTMVDRSWVLPFNSVRVDWAKTIVPPGAVT